MAVAIAVNGCVYCSWFHAKQAVDSGISEDEIKNMMSLQFQADADEYELMALLYV
ncbi:MAG: carboxymuconolactone decarboxylase family protein [Candidatus Marinimicrobia bacterium]|nr:carboxymuconolactone decarboxylase family protein [Candidatus Neomarinimicrobiota bacterium]